MFSPLGFKFIPTILIDICPTGQSKPQFLHTPQKMFFIFVLRLKISEIYFTAWDSGVFLHLPRSLRDPTSPHAPWSISIPVVAISPQSCMSKCVWTSSLSALFPQPFLKLTFNLPVSNTALPYQHFQAHPNCLFFIYRLF